MVGFAIGLSMLGLSGPVAGPREAPRGASLRAADDDAPRHRDSREDHRPAGRPLEMGPAATGLALAALGAAVLARRRRRAAG